MRAAEMRNTSRGRAVFRSAARIAVGLLLLLLSGSLPAREEAGPTSKPYVVYVGTPYDVISIMLEMARTGREDLVYDLGCGDGRMVILAAQKYGCRGIGYEIDPEMVRASEANVSANGVKELVKIVQADMFTLDLSEASVIMLYLLPELNRKLVPQLDRMKPGSRVICHNYGIPGIEADQTLTYLSNEDQTTHVMTLYTTPLRRTAAARQ
jgi:SAM-dependent methyltransferase